MGGPFTRAPLPPRFGMTVLCIVLSVFPIVDVRNSPSFTAKIVVLILGINAVGISYFGRRTRNSLGLAEPEPSD
ncbi:MAG TPA: hypothetical protein VMV57_02470 [Terracidiphilus sp.]|nr:hypothetical protein [Terracidiphilus sp.]